MKKCAFCGKCGHVFDLNAIDQDFECQKYNYEILDLPKLDIKISGACWDRNKKLIEVDYDHEGNIIKRVEDGIEKPVWRKRK